MIKLARQIIVFLAAVEYMVHYAASRWLAQTGRKLERIGCICNKYEMNGRKGFIIATSENCPLTLNMKIPHNQFGNVYLPIGLFVITLIAAGLATWNATGDPEGKIHGWGWVALIICGLAAIIFKVCAETVRKEEDETANSRRETR